MAALWIGALSGECAGESADLASVSWAWRGRVFQEICTSCFFLLAVSVCMGKGRALWLQLYVSISTILRSLWGYSRGKLCEPVLGIQEGAHI